MREYPACKVDKKNCPVLSTHTHTRFYSHPPPEAAYVIQYLGTFSILLRHPLAFFPLACSFHPNPHPSLPFSPSSHFLFRGLLRVSPSRSLHNPRSWEDLVFSSLLLLLLRSLPFFTFWVRVILCVPRLPVHPSLLPSLEC